MSALRRHILLVIGPIIFLGGLMYGVEFVNVPYQDTPPDVAERWNHDRRIADTLCLAGAIVLAGGCAQEIIRAIARRRVGPQN